MTQHIAVEKQLSLLSESDLHSPCSWAQRFHPKPLRSGNICRTTRTRRATARHEHAHNAGAAWLRICILSYYNIYIYLMHHVATIMTSDQHKPPGERVAVIMFKSQSLTWWEWEAPYGSCNRNLYFPLWDVDCLWPFGGYWGGHKVPNIMCIRRKQPTERRWISRIAAVAPAERWSQITWACTASCTPPWKLISKHVKMSKQKTRHSKRLFRDIPINMACDIMWWYYINYYMEWPGIAWNGIVTQLFLWFVIMFGHVGQLSDSCAFDCKQPAAN